MFLVVTPDMKALNLDAAEELANFPPEQEGGPSRLLAVINGHNYTVYEFTLNDLIQARIHGTTWVARRWVKGVRPSIPGGGS